MHRFFLCVCVCMWGGGNEYRVNTGHKNFKTYLYLPHFLNYWLLLRVLY